MSIKYQYHVIREFAGMSDPFIHTVSMICEGVSVTDVLDGIKTGMDIDMDTIVLVERLSPVEEVKT